jgi:type IV secretory pathway VirB2 component (pilin)
MISRQSRAGGGPGWTRALAALGQAIIVVALVLVATDLAAASETGMPWESPLNRILASITGPVAKGLGVLAIVIAGIGIAFGEGGSGVRRLLQVVFGLSIAFTASSFFLALFGFSGGSAF